MLSHIEDHEDYLNKVMFSEEVCFHVSGKVNQHNVRICSSENPHVVNEHIRDSTKVNVWCGLLHNRLVGPFFYAENTVTATIYMNMLKDSPSHRLKTCNSISFFNRPALPFIGP